MGYDWTGISRWCLAGTLAMLVWLLAPVARCSWGAFRDTPISELDEETSSAKADSVRVQKGMSFFNGLMIASSECYERSPLPGEELWERQMLFLFGGATALTWCIARATARKRFD